MSYKLNTCSVLCHQANNGYYFKSYTQEQIRTVLVTDLRSEPCKHFVQKTTNVENVLIIM